MNDWFLMVVIFSAEIVAVFIVILVVKYVRPALPQAEHLPKPLPEATRCSSR